MPGKLRCSNYHLTLTIGPGETYMDGTTERFIWGATAGMLVSLHRVLQQGV